MNDTSPFLMDDIALEYPNSSNMTESDTWFIPHPYMTVTRGVLAVLVLLDIWVVLVNAFILTVILANVSLKTRRNLWFACSLCLVGFAIGIFVLPLTIVYDSTGNWPFSTGVCIAWMLVDSYLQFVSAMAILVIASDRLIFVITPLRYKGLVTVCIAVVMLIATWIPPAFFIPAMLFSSNHSEVPASMCYTNLNVPASITVFVITFLCPLLLAIAITIATVTIAAMTLNRSSCERKKKSTFRQNMESSIIICTVLAVLWILTLAPMHFFQLLIALHVAIPSQLVLDLAHWGTFLFYAVAPLVWLSVAQVRSALVNTFFCTASRRRNPYIDDDVTTSTTAAQQRHTSPPSLQANVHPSSNTQDDSIIP